MKQPRVGNCSDCGTGITSQSKTGLCIPCGNRKRWADPEFRAKRAAGIKKKFADPLYMAKVRANSRQIGLKYAKDEELQERRRAYGRYAYATFLSKPEVREKNRQAVRERSAKTQRAKRMAWCPEKYWDDYRHLRKSKKLTAAEARQVILASIAAEKENERARIARLSPFERQELALKRGGQLIANDLAPTERAWERLAS